MIYNLKMSRLLRVTVATCALLPLAGCKHVSTWSNVSPSVSTPTADPFGYPPSSDGYLHRPESPLTPVPALPDPGHSIPIEPPVPPPPAEAGNPAPGESISAKGKPWALRPMSFLPRKDARSNAVQPANELVEKSPEKTTQGVGMGKPSPLPLSKFDSTAAPQVRQNSKVLSSADTAFHSKPKLTAPSSEGNGFVDESYTGPVITPGSQYTIGRDVAIQDWPHTQRPATGHQATLKLRKEPQFTADDFVPVAPPQTSELLPPPAAASPAAVPLLLPPGS